jgi:hypothetical protein
VRVTVRFTACRRSTCSRSPWQESAGPTDKATCNGTGGFSEGATSAPVDGATQEASAAKAAEVQQEFELSTDSQLSRVSFSHQPRRADTRFQRGAYGNGLHFQLTASACGAWPVTSVTMHQTTPGFLSRVRVCTPEEWAWMARTCAPALGTDTVVSADHGVSPVKRVGPSAMSAPSSQTLYQETPVCAISSVVLSAAVEKEPRKAPCTSTPSPAAALGSQK